MKRQTIFLIVFLVAILAMSALIFSKRTNNVDNSLVSQVAPNESESLLAGNGSAINSANAQANVSIPVISDKDQLVLGDKKAPLKMVVYEDLSSAFSSNYDATLKQLVKDNNDQLAVYVRPYFESDNTLALQYQAAVVCAGEEDKYTEMRDSIFSQKPLTLDGLVDEAKKLGLNGTKFSACLNNSENQAKIARSVEDIRMIAVFGAPTTILDGEVITGARALADTKNGEGEDIEGLKNIVSRHLAGK